MRDPITALLAPTLARLMLRRRGVAMFGHAMSPPQSRQGPPDSFVPPRGRFTRPNCVNNRASGEFRARSERAVRRRATREEEETENKVAEEDLSVCLAKSGE